MSSEESDADKFARIAALFPDTDPNKIRGALMLARGNVDTAVAKLNKTRGAAPVINVAVPAAGGDLAASQEGGAEPETTAPLATTPKISTPRSRKAGGDDGGVDGGGDAAFEAANEAAEAAVATGAGEAGETDEVDDVQPAAIVVEAGDDAVAELEALRALLAEKDALLASQAAEIEALRSAAVVVTEDEGDGSAGEGDDAGDGGAPPPLPPPPPPPPPPPAGPPPPPPPQPSKGPGNDADDADDDADAPPPTQPPLKGVHIDKFTIDKDSIFGAEPIVDLVEEPFVDEMFDMHFAAKKKDPVDPVVAGGSTSAPAAPLMYDKKNNVAAIQYGFLAKGEEHRGLGPIDIAQRIESLAIGPQYCGSALDVVLMADWRKIDAYDGDGSELDDPSQFLVYLRRNAPYAEALIRLKVLTESFEDDVAAALVPVAVVRDAVAAINADRDIPTFMRLVLYYVNRINDGRKYKKRDAILISDLNAKVLEHKSTYDKSMTWLGVFALVLARKYAAVAPPHDNDLTPWRDRDDPVTGERRLWFLEGDGETVNFFNETRAIVHEAIKASLAGASKKLGEVTIAFKEAKDEAEKFVGKLLGGGGDDDGGEGTSDANGAGVGAGGSLADASPQVQRFGQYVNRVVPEINEHIKRARAELDGVTADFEALRARFEGSASKTPPELFFGQLHVFLASVAEALEERVAKNLGELSKQQARLEKLKVMQAASASRRAGGSGDGSSGDALGGSEAADLDILALSGSHGGGSGGLGSSVRHRPTQEPAEGDDPLNETIGDLNTTIHEGVGANGERVDLRSYFCPCCGDPFPFDEAVQSFAYYICANCECRMDKKCRVKKGKKANGKNFYWCKGCAGSA